MRYAIRFGSELETQQLMSRIGWTAVIAVGVLAALAPQIAPAAIWLLWNHVVATDVDAETAAQHRYRADVPHRAPWHEIARASMSPSSSSCPSRRRDKLRKGMKPMLRAE